MTTYDTSFLFPFSVLEHAITPFVSLSFLAVKLFRQLTDAHAHRVFVQALRLISMYPVVVVLLLILILISASLHLLKVVKERQVLRCLWWREQLICNRPLLILDSMLTFHLTLVASAHLTQKVQALMVCVCHGSTHAICSIYECNPHNQQKIF